MKGSKQQLQKIEAFARRVYKKNNNPYHDLDHALSVSKTAVYIAKQEKADVEVCRIAALLHDIAPKTRGKTHSQQSGKMAKRFLAKIGLDKEFINAVQLAIMYHDTARFHLVKTKEGIIVFEADKLEGAGPIGLLREYGDRILLHHHNPKLVLKELPVYLRHYNPPVRTRTAKRLKKEIQQFNKEFIRLLTKYRTS